MDFITDSSFKLETLLQTAIAMILGALIGMDREYARKPAGLRTHMLVAGAAALIVKLSEFAITHFEQAMNMDLLQADPVRVFVAVVTGVSFLGAGTIIRQRDENRVEGLTTAAALLFSAVIGMGVALSQYILAAGATGLAILVLWSLGRVEHAIARRSSQEE